MSENDISKALEILAESGSDLEGANLVTACRVVVDDLKSLISGRNFQKRELADKTLFRESVDLLVEGLIEWARFRREKPPPIGTGVEINDSKTAIVLPSCRCPDCRGQGYLQVNVEELGSAKDLDNIDCETCNAAGWGYFLTEWKRKHLEEVAEAHGPLF